MEFSETARDRPGSRENNAVLPASALQQMHSVAKLEREREPTVAHVLRRATFLADARRITTTGRAFGKQGGRFEHLDLAYREVWLFKPRHEATGTGDSDYLAQVRLQIDTGGG